MFPYVAIVVSVSSVILTAGLISWMCVVPYGTKLPSIFPAIANIVGIIAVIMFSAVLLFTAKILVTRMKRGTKMKRNNTLALFAAAVVAIFLGWCLFSTPEIEVKPFNKSPMEAGDYNLSLLPFAKQTRVYSNLVIVRVPFKGKDYVTAYPQDAVTVTGSGSDTRACVYTNDPDTVRIKKYFR